MKRYRVLVWGCGDTYNQLSPYLNAQKEQIKICAIISGTPVGFHKIDGYPVITPKEHNKYSYDYIIIASSYTREITKSAIECGINKDVLIRYQAFFVPEFQFDRYLRIREKKPTIIANFCIGGRLYHTLGLEFLSPTINMTCCAQDYVEFNNNLAYYLSKDMQSYDGMDHIDGLVNNERYMNKGIIDNKVVWIFNHYPDCVQAVNKWNERKERVNLDQVYVIMILQTENDVRLFQNLKMKHKIGFYYKDVKVPGVINLKGWKNPMARQEYNYCFPSFANRAANYVAKYGQDVIDWLRFLDDEDEYIRKY